MNIEIVDDNISVKDFADGNIVLRITALWITPRGSMGDGERDIGMVITKEDYEEKLYTHIYNPVLFLSEFPLKLAYLFGCLNYNYKKSRDEIFIVWWRKIRTDEWKKWFIIHPYEEKIY